MSKPNEMDNRFLVGLDIGTTKICCVVAYMNEDLTMEIKGFGEAPADGMANGRVVDARNTIASIKGAVGDAETHSGMRITSAYVGMAGDFIRSRNSNGAIAPRTGKVTQDDIDRVLRSATTIAIPSDYEILHNIPQEFRVDDQPGIKNPLDLTCSRLEADVHIIMTAKSARQDIINCVLGSGLNVNNIFLESIASAEAVLTPQEKQLGVALLDIGGGTVDVAVFAGGSVHHTFELPVAGKAMTDDLAQALNQGHDTAESIKVDFGCCSRRAIPERLQINVPSIGGDGTVAIYNETVCDILEARMTSIFQAVENGLAASGTLELVRNIVLTGGCSQMMGMRELAYELFHTPVRVGQPNYGGGMSSNINNPKYSTVVGLLLYGWRGDEPNVGQGGDGPKDGGFINLIKGLWRKS